MSRYVDEHGFPIDNEICEYEQATTNDFCGVLCDFAESLVAKAKAEAIKEFAERVKSYLHQDDFETPDERWKPESEFATLIDNLVKEMI